MITSNTNLFSCNNGDGLHNYSMIESYSYGDDGYGDSYGYSDGNGEGSGDNNYDFIISDALNSIDFEGFTVFIF